MTFRPAVLLILLSLPCRGGSSDGAQAAFRRALADSISRISARLSASPGNQDLLAVRGQVKLTLGDYAGAADDFTAALAPGEADVSLLYYRAVCYKNLQQPGKAVTDLTQAIALAPSDGALYAEMGSVELGRNKPEAALSWYHKGLEAEPGNPPLLLLRGTCYYLMQNYARAIPDLTAAIRADHETGRARFLRARCLAAQGLKKKAVTDYGTVLAEDPSHFRALFYRGFLLLETGRKKDGIADLNAYLKLQGAINPSAEKVREVIRRHGYEPEY